MGTHQLSVCERLFHRNRTVFGRAMDGAHLHNVDRPGKDACWHDVDSRSHESQDVTNAITVEIE